MGESDQHRQLKQVAFGILLKKSCWPVGVEVQLPYMSHNAFMLDYGGRHVCDAAGICWHTTMDATSYRSKRRVRTLYAVEVKVSRSDLKAGYCSHGWGKLWFLTPPDMVPSEELPGGVGLYECDLDTAILKLKHRAAFSGYELDPKEEEKMRDGIVSSGYNYGVRARLEANPIVGKVLSPVTLETFYEEGEEKQITEEKED